MVPVYYKLKKIESECYVVDYQIRRERNRQLFLKGVISQEGELEK